METFDDTSVVKQDKGRGNMPLRVLPCLSLDIAVEFGVPTVEGGSVMSFLERLNRFEGERNWQSRPRLRAIGLNGLA